MSWGVLEAFVAAGAFLVLAAWFPWGALLQGRYTRLGNRDWRDVEHDEGYD